MSEDSVLKPRYSSLNEDAFEGKDRERAAFDRLLPDFSCAMGERFSEKVEEGWGGWDASQYIQVLESKLAEKVSRGLTSPKDLVDIANFAAFLWNFRITEEKGTDNGQV